MFFSYRFSGDIVTACGENQGLIGLSPFSTKPGCSSDSVPRIVPNASLRALTGILNRLTVAKDRKNPGAKAGHRRAG